MFSPHFGRRARTFLMNYVEDDDDECWMMDLRAVESVAQREVEPSPQWLMDFREN